MVTKEQASSCGLASASGCPLADPVRSQYEEDKQGMLSPRSAAKDATGEGPRLQRTTSHEAAYPLGPSASTEHI